MVGDGVDDPAVPVGGPGLQDVPGVAHEGREARRRLVGDNLGPFGPAAVLGLGELAAEAGPQ